MRIALALLLFTTVARAGSNEVAIGSSSRALRTDSANAVTGDSLDGGTLGYARALDLELVPGLELWADAGFAWASVDGTMFQTLSTQIHSLAFTIGARARYELLSHVAASARLDVGAARAALKLMDDADHSASDHGWGGLTEGAVGLELYAIQRPRLSLGLRLELGYVATTSVGMTATPESVSEGTLQLQMTAASLGGLNLSGPAFAASIVSQF